MTHRRLRCVSRCSSLRHSGLARAHRASRRRALDALEEAIAALNAKAEDIKAIDVATFRFATVMCNPDPPSYLNDGQQVTRSCDSPREDCLNPYDEFEIRRKFHQLAGLALTPRGLDELERAIEGFENWTSGTELTDLLRLYCRPDWSRLPSVSS